MAFKVGDDVCWAVRGSSHVGKVIEIVAANSHPRSYTDSYGVPGSRNHESYIVDTGKKLYYPRTKDLYSA